MKILLIGFILIVLTCLLISGFMLYNKIEGWGWFLFASILFGAGISYSENQSK